MKRQFNGCGGLMGRDSSIWVIAKAVGGGR